MFDQVDQDGDGELDEHEFIKSLFSLSTLFIFFLFRIFSISFSMITTCLSPFLFSIFLEFNFSPVCLFSYSKCYYSPSISFSSSLPRGCLRDPDFVLILNAPGVDPEEMEDE